MAEIIDVLTPLYSSCPEFDVVAPATAGHKAALVRYPVTPDYRLYVDGAPASNVWGRFQSRDNIRLLTAGIYLPESFVTADTSKGANSIAINELVFKIYKSDGTTYSTTMPGLGARGAIGVPFLNYEIAFDIFCDMSKPSPVGVPVYNNTVSLPSSPVKGVRYQAQVTANGWTIARYYEWSGAAWIDCTGVPLFADNEFYIGVVAYISNISMIGVPALLNGDTIKVIPFIKILHSLPIIQ